MEQIINTAARLSDYLGQVDAKIKDTFFDEKTIEEFFDEVGREVKDCLTKVFGAENDTGDYGYVGDILSYPPGLDEQFSDSVIFSYWTYRGDRNNYQVEEAGEWRENFFYKGSRWSKPAWRDQFYTFFKRIVDATDGKVPVNFFTEIGIESGKQYFKLLAGDGDTEDDATVVLPTAEQLLALDLPKTNALINKIKQWRSCVSAHRDDKTIKHIMGLCDNSQENIRALFLGAADELTETDVTARVKENITSVFSNSKTISVEDRNIAPVMLGFLYYDHPYDIHFYIPQPRKGPAIDRNPPKSALIVTVKQGLTKINDYKETFLKFSTILREFPRIERMIWHQWREDLPKYWQWKKNYEKRQKKYERLSEMAINVCRAVCDIHDIECNQHATPDKGI